MAMLRPDPPRGVLHTPGGARSRHVRYLASETLSAFVEHYWLVQWDRRGLPPHRTAVMSHPSVHITVSGSHAEVTGIVLGRFERVLEGTGRVFGIKLRPGAFYPLVRTPASTFTNRSVPLVEVFGEPGARYAAAVAAAPDDDRCIAAAEAFLRGLAPVPDEGMALARAIVERAATDRAILRVEQLAAAFALDKRSLQRLFSRYVGASPKWVIQRYRIHEAIDRLAEGETIDATTLALDLGYFDQAHFIKTSRRSSAFRRWPTSRRALRARSRARRSVCRRDR